MEPERPQFLNNMTEEDLRAWFAPFLEAIMAALDMKPKEFAFKLGVSRSLVYNYLKKRQPVTWATVDFMELIVSKFDWEPEDGGMVVSIKNTLLTMLFGLKTQSNDTIYDTPKSLAVVQSPTIRELDELLSQILAHAEQKNTIDFTIRNAPMALGLLVTLYTLVEQYQEKIDVDVLKIPIEATFVHIRAIMRQCVIDLDESV